MCYHYTTSASLKQHALDVSSGALVLDHILSSTLAGNRIRGSSCFLSLQRRRKQSFIFRQVFLLSFFLGFRIQFIKSNFFLLFFLSISKEKKGQTERYNPTRAFWSLCHQRRRRRRRTLLFLSKRKAKKANDDFPISIEVRRRRRRRRRRRSVKAHLEEEDSFFPNRRRRRGEN